MKTGLGKEIECPRCKRKLMIYEWKKIGIKHYLGRVEKCPDC